MALFGNPNAYLGIDIGTSSLKVVELMARKKRIEITTYAQTDIENPLVDEARGDAGVKDVAAVMKTILEKAGVTSDQAVVALPSSAVFTAVIELPSMPNAEMDKAVEFAAKDIVPADLEDVVLGYSSLGHKPHMAITANGPPATAPQTLTTEVSAPPAGQSVTPVFITAAPKYLVNRYIELVNQLELHLIALEIETFPLVRSLLPSETASGMIVDIGDRATTYHVIDKGTPRVSFTAELGGATVTEEIAAGMSISVEEANALKIQYGATGTGSPAQQAAVEKVVKRMTDGARELLDRYMQQESKQIGRTVLIGGGANLQGLPDLWTRAVNHTVTVGNPWRGLAYPAQLESRLRYLGPVYGVAVGLALRNFTTVADGSKEI